MCTAMLMIYEQVNAERPGRLRRLTMHQIRWRSEGPPVVTTVVKSAELPPLRQHIKPTKVPVVEGGFEEDVGELLVLLGVLSSHSDAAGESARAMLDILF
jgi:hypothetical protein